MNALFKIVSNVIQRRAEAGEKLDDIFKDYPKLSQEEKEEITQLVVRDRVSRNLKTNME